MATVGSKVKMRVYKVESQVTIQVNWTAVTSSSSTKSNADHSVFDEIERVERVELGRRQSRL